MTRPPQNSDEDHSVRLQKFLAAAGIGSRRHCEEYVEAGRVTVDGEVACDLGTRVDPQRQEVRLDGEVLRRDPKRYYLLNKPAGVVCTHRDPQGRPRAVDLVPENKARLFTVGRLDENSLGLLLVTNDGDLANRLAHPRYQVPRTYRVQVAGVPSQEMLGRLKRGVHFREGTFRVRSVRRIRSKGKSTYLELTLTEGRNREIRRMLARLGHKVLRLERVGFGPLKLGRLSPGAYRSLKPAEVASLREYVFSKPRNKKKASRPRGARGERPA